MSETLHKIKASYKCYDESFSPEKCKEYALFIQVSFDVFSVAILDVVRNKFIVLMIFPIQKANSESGLIEKLNELVQSYEWLSREYKQVNVSFVNKKFTLIPTPLYLKEKEKSFLEFNHVIEPQEIILSDTIKTAEAVAVFAIPKLIHEEFVKLFKNLKVHHFCSSLIEMILSQYKNQTKRKVFIHVQPSHFEVLVAEGGKLFFFNTFQHQTSEDFIYYILFVCEQLQMNPEELDLVLLGEIEKNSALYEILHKYIRNISFGTRNENYQFSYKLDTVPSHFYYSILSQSLADH
jgi:hypothetical protein